MVGRPAKEETRIANDCKGRTDTAPQSFPKATLLRMEPMKGGVAMELVVVTGCFTVLLLACIICFYKLAKERKNRNNKKQ